MGAGGCTLRGILTLLQGSDAWIFLGVWLVGDGANYLPLALEAQRLSRPGALDAAVADTELGQERRPAANSQLWIAVPFAMCVAAVTQRRRPRS